MYKKLLIIFLVSVAACAPGVDDTRDNSLTPAEKKDGWKLLFDGYSLEGWRVVTPGSWVSSDGTITHGSKETGGVRGMIWTSGEYGDFILKCEFKIEPECNSGIFFRVGDSASPVQTGLEMQVIDSFNRPKNGPLATHSCGALYDIAAPSHNTAKPAGEWNRAKITCKGSIISISLNGDQVVSTVDLDKYTEPHLNTDGTQNKFNLPLKDFPRSGRIGFQKNGGRAWFRNIKIKEL